MTEKVIDENQNEYILKDILGSGGQGAVFTVADNDSVVVKALVDDKENIIMDQEIYKKYKSNIRNVITVGEFEYTAVPFAMLKSPYCGYLMRLMTGLASVDKLMLPYIVENNKSIEIPLKFNEKKNSRLAKNTDEVIFSYNSTGGLKKRLMCLAKLAKIMGKFQDKGVVYCDLSPNNIYVSRTSSDHEVWLIDTDNLSFEGDVKHGIGTPSFMAPEIFNGKTNTVKSDAYSFALVAFRLLTYKDPFVGKMQDSFDSDDDWDEEGNDFDSNVARGDIPWIWEYENDENRSDTGLNARDLLTPRLMDLFEQTFNKTGRHNPKSRPNMWEWYDALLNAYESLTKARVTYSDDFHSKILKLNYFDSYVCNKNIFNSNEKIERLKVNIDLVKEIEADDGNVYVPVFEKTLYWDRTSKAYSFSNYDLMLKKPEIYIRDFLQIKNIEDSNMENNYVFGSLYGDYRVKAYNGNKIITKSASLLDVTFYVFYKGKIVKRITFDKEEL